MKVENAKQIQLIVGTRQTGKTTKLLRHAIKNFSTQKLNRALNKHKRPEWKRNTLYVASSNISTHIQGSLTDEFGYEILQVCRFHNKQTSFFKTTNDILDADLGKEITHVLLDDVDASDIKDIKNLSTAYPHVVFFVALS